MKDDLRFDLLEDLGYLVALEDVCCEVGGLWIAIALSVYIDGEDLGGWRRASKFPDKVVSKETAASKDEDWAFNCGVAHDGSS